MSKIQTAVVLSVFALASSLSVSAHAGSWSGDVRVQGPQGRGYTAAARVDRSASGVSASRSLQTNDGRGAYQSHQSTYGGGAYSSTSQTTFNNGWSRARTTSAQDNGDGTASYRRTITTSDGYSRSVSGTVPYGPR